MALAVYEASPIKRYRRTKVELADLQEGIEQVVSEIQPATVRQVFYQAVTRGLVPKSEASYDVVGREVLRLRREGRIPYGWIADNTRWMRKPRTHHGLRQMLERERDLYRRALWDDQNVHVEIWLEKDALAGVVYEVTEIWDVPLMVTRGFSSESFAYEAANTIADSIEAREPVHVYYFGDHDPSGRLISTDLERRLLQMTVSLFDDRSKPVVRELFNFERVAVNPEQIAAWNLPTRPTKTKGTHAKSFKGESVEVDAIPPDQLRALVRGCIEKHVNEAALARTVTVEQAERDSLAAIIDRLPREAS